MEQLGGEIIHPDRTVTFGAEVQREMVGTCVDASAEDSPANVDELVVNEPDFEAKYDPRTLQWTMGWKWNEEAGPRVLHNRREQCCIPEDAKSRCEQEVKE